MANLVSDILSSVGARANLDTALPTGTELGTQVSFVEQAQLDWENYTNWRILKGTDTPTVLLSMTSIGLNTRFKKLLSPVYDYSTGLDSPTEYKEIPAEDRFRKLSTDKYVYAGGNDITGKYLVINPALASGASITFDWKSTASSLATTSDAITCPSKKFMIERTTFYVLEARSDQRFPIVESRSNTLLENLLEEEQTPSGGEDNRVPDWARKNNFRIGQD